MQTSSTKSFKDLFVLFWTPSRLLPPDVNNNGSQVKVVKFPFKKWERDKLKSR